MGLVALLSVTANAQRDYTREYNSTPTWPDKGGVHPDHGEPDGDHVFLSEDRELMVLVYWIEVGRSVEGKEIGDLRVERFDRNNQVDASIAVDVHRSGSNYIYDYHVSNSTQARQAIRNF